MRAESHRTPEGYAVTYQTLKYEIADRIATVTLNRPDQLNAFTVEMAEELVDVFEKASLDDAVGAVVVTGAGRAFCAGMDLSSPGNVFGLDETQTPTLDDMRARRETPAIHRGVRDTGGRVTLAIFACRKPVIGAINGPAVGIGATMTLPMDFRFASQKARIGFVFGKIGVTPEACSSWFLPRLVGIETALEWVYKASIFDAAEAKEKGLVRTVTTPETLLEEATAFAKELIQDKSAVAVALARQMLWRNSAMPHPMDAHIVDSLAMFYASIGDGKEGVASFLEKRTPAFESRASQMPAFFEAWTKGG